MLWDELQGHPSVHDRKWPEQWDRPSSDDLDLGVLPHHPEFDSLVAALEEGLPVLLMAPPDSGKTFLALQICKYFSGKDWNIRLARARDLDDEDLRRVETLGGLDERCLLAIDDCEDDPAGRVDDLLALRGSLALLLITRARSDDDLPDWAITGGPREPTLVKIEPRVLAHAVVNEFREREGRALDEQRLFALMDELGTDNLSRLVYALSLWVAQDPEDAAADQQLSERIVKWVARDVQILPGPDPFRCKALHTIAKLGRYGFPVQGGSFSPEELQSLGPVVAAGVVSRDGNSYSLAHPKTCEWVIRAADRYCAHLREDSELDAFLADARLELRNSLSILREGDVGRWFSVLGSPHTYQAALAAQPSAQSRRVVYDAWRFSHSGDRQGLAGKFGPEILNIALESLRAAAGHWILKMLRPLIRMLGEQAVRDEVASWAKKDWAETISHTRINALRNIAYQLGSNPQQLGWTECVPSMAEGFARADLEHALDPSHAVIGGRGVYGFVHNIESDGGTEATRLVVDRLMEEDLSQLFRAARLRDSNALLARFHIYGSSGKVAENFAERHLETFVSLSEEEDIASRVWLLRNIWALSRSRACDMVASLGSDHFLPSLQDPMHLPALGLLGLCDQGVEVIADAGLVARTNREQSPTLIALLLASLARVPARHALWEDVDWDRIQRLIEERPVPAAVQLVAELRDLLLG